ncbi:hypothetical protein [Flavobacterium gilvum]|uniref:Uncharacterized protein n=1 Tax=Flavobacterium gilvum TaxID=1492737 RepID=A0AAC9N3I7_9FLAO|nr:hypothetical protein [Flavobacterium gilvum]AOW08920.1 hypothetical protein EM308_05025 [Flavobacterium gilvum]KFC60929.1 hypothetical protein FEM08_03190 [Flavobacterium gilvum]
MKNNSFLVFLFLLISAIGFSQVYTNKVVGKKNAELLDSLKVQEYPYALPIWGDKATKKGFQLPYSAGVSLNYFWQESEMTFKNLEVGFNNGPMYNLDQIVRFHSAKVSGSALNVRPDIWLFPFLNVYGILGKADMSTNINAGVWVPDADNNWTEVLPFNTKTNFDGTTFGLGLTPTIGIGGGWLALDMNVAWTDIPQLEKPAMSFIFGPRVGKTFKLAKPETNIAVWAGAFRVHIKSETKGSLPLSDIFPSDGSAQSKVDQAQAKVDEKQTNVNNWWNSLSNAEQAKPSNKAKYETANRALEAAGNLLNGIDGALSTLGDSSVQYSLEKSQTNMWNFILGSQYQFNRHFMLRAECGFLGTRTQFMTSFQYRFGL